MKVTDKIPSIIERELILRTSQPILSRGTNFIKNRLKILIILLNQKVNYYNKNQTKNSNKTISCFR